MSYRTCAFLAAIINGALFLALLLAPQLYTPTYGVAADAGSLFMTRRAAPMFLGFAVILWVSKDAMPGAARDAISWGIAAAFIGIAATGLWAWAAGQASPMILGAAGLEILLACVLVFSNRR